MKKNLDKIIEKCSFKILSEMYSPSILLEEQPDFKECIKCSGYDKKKICYISLYHSQDKLKGGQDESKIKS